MEQFRMHRKYSIWMIVLLVAISSAAYAYQGGGWMLLGTARVDGGVDHDTIRAGGTGTFRAIQLRVNGGAVQFNKVIVRYGNGQFEEIALRNKIPAGGSSRQIDLSGSRRAISRVDLWYQKANWGSNRPAVSIFGIR
jgi:hypothetical protein